MMRLKKQQQDFKSPPPPVLVPPEVLEICGEWLFIFRELGSTGIYFQGFREHAHSFGDLGSPAKNVENLTLKEKRSFRLIF